MDEAMWFQNTSPLIYFEFSLDMIKGDNEGKETSNVVFSNNDGIGIDTAKLSVHYIIV